MESLRIIQICAAAIWADGVLHPNEIASFKQLIANSGLEPAAATIAHGYLLARPALDFDDLEELDGAYRKKILRAAQHLIASDGNIKDSELEFLAKLRKALDLNDEPA